MVTLITVIRFEKFLINLLDNLFVSSIVFTIKKLLNKKRNFLIKTDIFSLLIKLLFYKIS